jgi:hypothetical protein
MRQVHCDQCGRGLTLDDAGMGICPSCGWAAALPVDTLAAAFPTGDDAMTRPVSPAAGATRAPTAADRATSPPPPPLDALTAPATPYSRYEPPSLPRSSGQDAPSGSGAVASSGPPPAARLDQTATLPPGLLPADGQRTSGGKPALERRRGRMATSAVGLLVILLLGSAGAILAANGRLSGLLGGGPTTVVTPSPTTQSGPRTPPPGFHTYTASDGSFTLWVRDTWATVPVSQRGIDLTLFSHPTTQSNFEIESIPGTPDPTGLDDQFITKLVPLAPGATGTATVSGQTAPDTVPAAGALWTRKSADITVVSAGQTTVWHVVTLAVQHGQKALLIAYFSPSPTFAAVDGTDFQPMLGSLVLAS